MKVTVPLVDGSVITMNASTHGTYVMGMMTAATEVMNVTAVTHQIQEVCQLVIFNLR